MTIYYIDVSASRLIRSAILLVLLASLAGMQHVALLCPIRHHATAESAHGLQTHGDEGASASDHTRPTVAGVMSSASTGHEGHESSDGRCVMVAACASALLTRSARAEFHSLPQAFAEIRAAESVLPDVEIPISTPPPKLFS